MNYVKVFFLQLPAITTPYDNISTHCFNFDQVTFRLRIKLSICIQVCCLANPQSKSGHPKIIIYMSGIKAISRI